MKSSECSITTPWWLPEVERLLVLALPDTVGKRRICMYMAAPTRNIIPDDDSLVMAFLTQVHTVNHVHYILIKVNYYVRY